MTFGQLQQQWPVFSRGATITFASDFFDGFNHAVEPATPPQVVVQYTLQSTGVLTNTTITMSQTGPNGQWVALWDSRGAAAGIVYWSVEAPGSPPVSVSDGQFTLEANPANQPTF